MKLSEMGENAPRFRKAVPKEKEKENIVSSYYKE